MEVVNRVASLPIVESGIGISEKIYNKIRESNPVIRWSFTIGERSLATGVYLAQPAVTLLEKPISQLDHILCKSLDIVEKRVPLHLPPQALYSETRRYVMRRADSVKQLGSAVLDSRMTVATAGALDRAIITADKYVDKYLPTDGQEKDEVTGAEVEGEGGLAKASQAVQHGARLRRKLQRRLTRQALAEAKAIKEQIHVIVYIGELVATNPALAWQKAKELYASLSGPEPENQARPKTLEELTVLLTREAARRIVHLINYTHKELPNCTRVISMWLAVASSHLSSVADSLLKTVHLGDLQELRNKLASLAIQLQATSKAYLVLLAVFLAGNEEREKIAPRSSYLDQQREDSELNGVN